MIGIYKITNPKNRIYIGQSIDIYFRFSCYRKNKCVSQPKLYNSLLKYGHESHLFEVLEECSIDRLNDLERYYQDLFNVIKNGLNCVLSSTDNRRGVMSQETKDKISMAHKGKTISEETRMKLRIINLGKVRIKKEKPTKPEKPPKIKRVLSEYTKNKIKESLTGRKRPKHIGLIISKKLKGRKLSDDHKKNMSLNNPKYNLGKKLSAETKAKIGLNNKMKRKVFNKKTGKTYISILEASKDIQVKYCTLRKMLSGSIRNKTDINYL